MKMCGSPRQKILYISEIQKPKFKLKGLQICIFILFCNTPVTLALSAQTISPGHCVAVESSCSELVVGGWSLPEGTLFLLPSGTCFLLQAKKLASDSGK